MRHLADDDTGLHGTIRVLLLKPIGEPIHECFVEAAGADEPIRLALALRVGGGDHIESLRGLDEHADLLDEDALTLKHGLKAHHPLRAQVDLVQEKDGTALHGLNHATVDELRFAVDEAEPTDQVILVSLGGNVDADALASRGRANLLDHRGLAVARQTRDVDGGELLGLQDRGDVIVVSPRNESVVLGRDEGDFGHGRDEVVVAAAHV